VNPVQAANGNRMRNNSAFCQAIRGTVKLLTMNRKTNRLSIECDRNSGANGRPHHRFAQRRHMAAADTERVLDQDEPADHGDDRGPDRSGGNHVRQPGMGRNNGKSQDQNATPSNVVDVISTST
jgi:hypothetical protein